MAAPKPLSVSTSPSLGPAAARVATQDAQIAQLVQQNRTLEYNISQLRAQLDAENARAIDAVNQIKDKWRSESREWRNGCDVLQAKHRLAHLGTRVALEHERGIRLEDKEALRREKIATLLREHKLTLFQARETELVAHVAALEDEIEVQREQLGQHEAELARVTTNLARSVAHATENGGLEAELTALRTSSDSYAKQVERLTLQVETLSTQKATTETQNRDLQHQVDRWQNLENKGEKEVEALRKRRIELDVRVKELEISLKESRGVDKKVGKLEASLLGVQEQVEQGQQSIIEAQDEAAQARKLAAKLERQVAKLQGALEAEKSRSADALEKEREKVRSLSKPASKAQSGAPFVILEVSEGSEHEVVKEPLAKPRTRNQKPASVRSDKPDIKGKDKEKRAPLPSEATDEPQRNKGREQAQQDIVEEVELIENQVKEQAEQNIVEEGELMEIEDEDQVQDIPPQVKKRGRARRQDQYSDIEEVSPPPNKPRSKAAQSKQPGDRASTKKPRAKPSKEKEADEDQLPKKRMREKPASTNGGQGAGKPPSVRADAEEEEEPQKKRKRKLNLAGGTNVFAGPAGFTWNQDGEGDLGIPSVLSPVKEGQPVPQRSGSSSLLGAWTMPWG